MSYKDIDDALKEVAVQERYEKLVILHNIDKERIRMDLLPLGKEVMRFLAKGK